MLSQFWDNVRSEQRRGHSDQKLNTQVTIYFRFVDTRSGNKTRPLPSDTPETLFKISGFLCVF